MLSCSQTQLKGKLSSEATTREGLETKIASLQARLAEEEEGRRNTHVSVNRLEAQVRRRVTTTRSAFRDNLNKRSETSLQRRQEIGAPFQPRVPECPCPVSRPTIGIIPKGTIHMMVHESLCVPTACIVFDFLLPTNSTNTLDDSCKHPPARVPCESFGIVPLCPRFSLSASG